MFIRERDLLMLSQKLNPRLTLIPIYSMVVTMVSTMDTMDTHMFIMERDLLMLSQKLILTYSMGHIIIIHTMDMHTILMDTTGENKSKCPQHSSPKSHLIHITNNSPTSETTTTFATSTDTSLPACLP